MSDGDGVYMVPLGVRTDAATGVAGSGLCEG
jgi:hypothetical protein